MYPSLLTTSRLAIAVLASERCLWADNCGSLSDCYGTATAAITVLAAIAAAAVIAGLVLPMLVEAAGAAGLEAAITSVGAALEGAGPWVGEASNLAEGGAIAQSLAGSCVSACGEMLSGGAMSEAGFLQQLGEWSNAGSLADALNAFEGSANWEGGLFASAEDAVAAAQQGQMGATLQAPYLPSHMVVIEPGEAGMFLVRDPAIGGTYEVTLEWIAKWVSGGVF